MTIDERSQLAGSVNLIRRKLDNLADRLDRGESQVTVAADLRQTAVDMVQWEFADLLASDDDPTPLA